ncbi:Acetolactate synthase, catabolic [Paraburkholderia hiiakae]|uniref:Acetolactate synthase, catabolic n=1 Tax=Paraburkholderia hiiakae TaxID=1081782 RepID=A0ABM8NTX0_9BURK|nr:thiamine pyrophosphate-binding protein [Paraburkholderia hiiakae]CAD6543293.1 Acetolactate synthase, catabolic [Paraburkholderia hiiakae]
MKPQKNIAQIIADAGKRHGVRRIFGVPGGGSSLDIIQAFAALDVPFVLAHTEAGAGMMAAADAEASGRLAIVVTTQGPGTASVANAIAQASLDRAPVLLITDGWTSKQAQTDSHQVFDQRALLSPLVKAHSRLEGDDVEAELERLIALAHTAPWGPVYIELTGENARRTLDVPTTTDFTSLPHQVVPPVAQRDEIAAAKAMIEAARRPVVVAGLETRCSEAAPALRTFVERLECPVFTTYKAKGVVSDHDDHAVGLFTGGALERECIDSADLIVLCGLDPVELIGRPWAYGAPVLDIGPVEHRPHYVAPRATVRGPLAAALSALADVDRAPGWEPGEIVRHKERMRSRLAYTGHGAGLTPEQVVKIAYERAEDLDARVTVDAGAHMFSAMAFWRARRGSDVLISNGLASMAFALPAGIAASLASPGRQVIAFTGDGGLLMCIGELATAARVGAKLCIVVFNDSTLSLIQIKQQGRGMARDGIDWPRQDFAAIARGFGLQAWSASTPEAYEAALARAWETQGPVLIDVHVDPSGYLEQSKALRG